MIYGSSSFSFSTIRCCSDRGGSGINHSIVFVRLRKVWFVVPLADFSISCRFNFKNANKYSSIIKQKLINEEDITSSKLYNISLGITSSIDPTEITNKILEITLKLQEQNIIPNEYSITINNKKENTKLKVNHLTQTTL